MRLGIIGEVLASRFGLWNGWRAAFRLRTMCVDCPDRQSVTFFVTTVGFWSKLDDRVQWNLDVREVGLWKIVEVCVEAAQDSLII